MVDINPNESIYLDMYTWGLKQIPYKEIEDACRLVGKEIRTKDYENYWRGYYKSAKRDPKFLLKIQNAYCTASSPEYKLRRSLSQFDYNPARLGAGVQQRWVPCSVNNKPMVKWSKQTFMKDEALAYPHMVYLAENLCLSNYIVIDCDGDHSDVLDLESIFFLYEYSNFTDCREKPKAIKEYPGYEASQCEIPASFHITFKTEKLIPTIHCPWAHVDILGNANNQLRYLKNKVWNGREPMLLTEDIWHDITHYLLRRKERM